MITIFLKVALTFDTFKLFFTKKIACLQIRPQMARNIDSIKTGKVGKNGGSSGTHRTFYIKKSKLTRAELLITLFYETPCRIGSMNFSKKTQK